MTGSTPARTGEPACDRLVEGGAASYRCSLPAGHVGQAPEDPEPCYAVEVPSSVRMWRAWRERQDHPLIEVSSTAGRHDDCGGKPRLDGGSVVCGGCGGKIGDVVGQPREVYVYRPPDPFTGDRVLEDAATAVEEDLGDLPERLRARAGRLTDRDALYEVARVAIARRFGESSKDWDAAAEAADAAVDAISTWLLEERR